MKYGYGVIILAITGFMISDTYNDGQYTKLLKNGWIWFSRIICIIISTKES